ncbi:MAG: hypothetical protein FJ225_11525 [Lentisphaerae bacterium]|nr:hypothetical protein [Lentisphaerota bacterium]
MKTQLPVLGSLLLAVVVMPAPRAGARGADSPESSILRVPSLSATAVGIEGGQEMRRLYYDTGGRADVRNLMGQVYLSLDVLSWLTINGGGGVADAVIAGPGVRHAPKPLWTAGFEAGLLQYDLFEPGFFESRATVHLLGTYLSHSLADRHGSRPWEEYRVALLAAAERFAKKDFGADRHASPYSLRLFIGPYYSEVDPAGLARDQEIGATAGADIRLARGFSLGYAIRYRDFTTHMMNVVLHF